MEYLCGCYLGDGSLYRGTKRDGSLRDKLRFSIVVTEYNKDELLSKIPRGKIKKEDIAFKNDKRESYKYYEITSEDVNFTKGLEKLCGDSTDKRVPENLNEAQFMELFSGLIDTDGHISKDNIFFYKTNENLVIGVAKYLSEFGIEYTRTGFQTDKKYKYMYTILITSRGLSRLNLKTS